MDMVEAVARIRLAPRRLDLVFEGRVNEDLRPALLRGGLEIKNLD
jgi:hypothetical protein